LDGQLISRYRALFGLQRISPPCADFVAKVVAGLREQ
jgi:hypothetical protein